MIQDSLGLAMSHVEARTPAGAGRGAANLRGSGLRPGLRPRVRVPGPAERVSAEYPKTIFIITSGRRSVGNVAPLIFRLEEASYLAGWSGWPEQSHVLGLRRRHRAPADRGRVPGLGERRPAESRRSRPGKIYLNSFDDAAAAGGGPGADPGRARTCSTTTPTRRPRRLPGGQGEPGGVRVRLQRRPGAPGPGPGGGQRGHRPAPCLPGGRAGGEGGTFHAQGGGFGLESGVVRYVPNPAPESMVDQTLRSRLQAAADSIAAGTLMAAPRPASMQAMAR